LKVFKFSFDFRNWQIFLKKSSVYILIGFFSGIYFKLDFYILKLLKGEAEVGVYSAGFKFFEALLFVAASYNISRTPILAKLIKSDKVTFFKVLKKDFLFLSGLGIGIAILVYLFSPLILPFFLPGKFSSSLGVLRIVIFAFPLILLSSVLINALYVRQKAYSILLIFLLQILINFSFNLFYVPKFSYWASAYITVLSEAINLIFLAGAFYYYFRTNTK